MILIQGKGVSKGVVKGPLYYFKRQDNTVIKRIVEDTENEKAADCIGGISYRIDVLLNGTFHVGMACAGIFST